MNRSVQFLFFLFTFVFTSATKAAELIEWGPNAKMEEFLEDTGFSVTQIERLKNLKCQDPELALEEQRLLVSAYSHQSKRALAISVLDEVSEEALTQELRSSWTRIGLAGATGGAALGSFFASVNGAIAGAAISQFFLLKDHRDIENIDETREENSNLIRQNRIRTSSSWAIRKTREYLQRDASRETWLTRLREFYQVPLTLRQQAEDRYGSVIEDAKASIIEKDKDVAYGLQKEYELLAEHFSNDAVWAAEGEKLAVLLAKSCVEKFNPEYRVVIEDRRTSDRNLRRFGLKRYGSRGRDFDSFVSVAN